MYTGLQNISKNNKCYYAYKRFHVISSVSKLTLYKSSVYPTSVTDGILYSAQEFQLKFLLLKTLVLCYLLPQP